MSGIYMETFGKTKGPDYVGCRKAGDGKDSGYAKYNDIDGAAYNDIDSQN